MKYVCTKGGVCYLPSFTKVKHINNNFLGNNYVEYEMKECYLSNNEIYEIKEASVYEANDKEYKYILKTERNGDWYISQTELDNCFRKALTDHCKVLIFDDIDDVNKELKYISVDELIDIKTTSDNKYMIIRKVKGDI